MKKILSLLLILCIVLTCSCAAFAEDNEARISIGGFEFVVTEGLSNALREELGIDIPANGGDPMAKLSEIDANAAAAALRRILDQTKQMSDDDLKAQITALAREYGYELGDDVIDGIVSLCRELESMTDAELADRMEQFKTTGSVIATAKGVVETVVDFGEKVVKFVDTVIDFFEDLFS